MNWKRFIVLMVALVAVFLNMTLGAFFLTAPPVQAAPPPLPTIIDPLFTNPVADPSAIPKFVNQLPQPPAIDMRAGGNLNMYIGQGTHDFGLLGPGQLPADGGLGLRDGSEQHILSWPDPGDHEEQAHQYNLA